MEYEAPRTAWVIGAAFLPCVLAAGCGEAPVAVQPPPPKVSVATPEQRQVAEYDQYNGWLRPAETVEVRARVRGHLDRIHFADGDLVRKGQLLFELDPRPFQAEIDSIKDQVKIYEAQYNAAAKEEARLRELVTKGGASQSQVDAAEAESDSLEAQIDATKQEVIRKTLDLEYSKITSPIDGRIGRAMLTTGNLVNAGGSDPVLATIVSVDPVHVYFDVDERALQRYLRDRTGELKAATSVREGNLPFSFGLETDDGFPHAGVLNFADNQIDPQTGTIQVRGLVGNADGHFVPGSRVRIRVPVSEPRPVLLVPDTAVLADQDRRYVLVLDEKNVVHRHDVELGKLLDDGMRVIRPRRGSSELAPDQRVITQGIQMARVNYPVEPVEPPTPAGAASVPTSPSAQRAPAAEH